MAKKKAAAEPAIRKSLLITGGVAIAAVLIGFVVMNFVLGGGDPSAPSAPIPAPSAPTAPAPGSDGAPATPEPTDVPGLKPGGRDPFAAGTGAEAPAPAPATVAAASATNETTSIAVLAVYGSAADIKVGDVLVEGAKQGSKITDRFDLDEIDGDCLYMKDGGERFKVCEGKNVKR